MIALTNKQILDGKYEIIHEIKKGGFGIVYYGIDNHLNKPVAIKEIAPSLLEEPKYLDMFQEEALNIAKLSHNNIVHIYELKKSSDGRLFIIMEYIDGIDLEKVTRIVKKTTKRIPTHLAIYIVAEICMALDYAHHRRDAFTNKALNLVHQDISPSNIMISRFGGVKLIDFGIASVKRHQTKEKRDNKLRGKIPYMSPEQLIMGNHPDHRSDLYSLGLVLYEILVGERLFNSQEEVIAAAKNPKWFKKALRGKKLPFPLEKILSKALEIDISKRYQNANHMYIDLLQYLISCNETGELMDNLADYINALIANNGKYIFPGNHNQTDTSGKIEDVSQPYPASPPIQNRWDAVVNDNKKEPNEPESTQHLKPETYRLTQFNNQSPNDLTDEDEEEEDLKTVIDVIRISARNNKKRFKQFALAALTGIVIFLTLDTLNGWTKAGIGIFDWLFPPAIEIVTVPSAATVLIDDKAIEGQTPLAIDKISPGVHKLQLNAAGYKSIIKSIYVPRKGAIHVQGETENSHQGSYLFNFNTEIEINSSPAGADVFINDIHYNQKTPCTITWEVGKLLAIALQHNGFEPLSGFALNTIEGYDVVEDRRFWEMTVSNDKYKKYSINGIFKKKIVFDTIPDRVEIFDFKTNSVLGVSGIANSVILKAGMHELELRKKNFIPQKINLKIDENVNEKVTAVLSRTIRFIAFDESNLSKNDIGANLVRLKRGTNNYLNVSRITPFEMSLPAYSYQALFQKPGYHNTEVNVGPADRLVQVEMEPLKAFVEVKVLDALSNQPVSEAEIYYNFVNNPQPLDLFLDRTTAKGAAFGQLSAGRYTFSIQKAGYRTVNKSVVMHPGEKQTIVFKIYLSN